MELVDLIQSSDKGHDAQYAADEFPSPPFQRPPQQPGEKRTSNQEEREMGRLVGSRKRRKVNIFAGKR
jgi:hypothetical protein